MPTSLRSTAPHVDTTARPAPQVCLFTLGRFCIEIDGEPLPLAGRRQRKPLQLLKALSAHRHGADVIVLMEQFWPDLDGDAARNALDLTLFRLRRVLRRKDAAVFCQGRLRLGAAVWVDSFELEAMDEQERAPDAVDQSRRLFQLYRGSFLMDEDQPWLFAARERLRSKFFRRVGALGRALRDEQQLEAMAALYQQACEIEPGIDRANSDRLLRWS